VSRHGLQNANNDNSPALHRHHRALGSYISQFPVDQETARSAIEAGEIVIQSNVVRGASQAARLSATETAEAGQ
jgi:alpha-D-ribose 1-methylphosphonate 5-triphosphate diphosphatase PhnM